MLRIKSLAVKFVFMGGLLLAFISVYVAAGYVFTHHIRDEAKRINLAGRQRMLTKTMAYNVRALSSSPSSEQDKPTESCASLKSIEKSMAEYEEALYGLRDGSGALGIGPVPSRNKESVSQLSELIVLWEKTQKPVLYDILKLPPERQKEGCGMCHRAVRDNFGKLEAFVNTLERYNKKEMEQFDAFRFYALAFFVVGGVFLLFYIRGSIIIPMRRLRDAAEEMAKGNLAARVEVGSEDEAGRLAGSFNKMAQSLGTSFADNAILIRNLQALRAATDNIIGDFRIEILLDKITETARELLCSRYAALGILDDKGGYEYFIPKGIEPGILEEMMKRHGLPRGKGLLGHLLKEGEVVRLGDMAEHPASSGFPEGHPPMKAFLGVPVILNRKVIGRLYFTNKVDGAHFTQEDEDLALSFANTVALSINNARILNDISSRNVELNVLNVIASASSQSLSLDAMLEKAMDAIVSLEPLMPEKRGAIFLCDEDTKTLKLAASRNFSEEHVKLCAQAPYGECLCGLCAEKAELVLSGSSTADKRHSRTYPGAKEHGHIILPLKSRDRMVGVLCLYLSADKKLTDREINLYKSISDLLSVAVQNVLSRRQVALLAQSLDSSGDLIIITDLDGRITHVNPQVQQCLGYRQQELVGKNISVIQSPRNRRGLGPEIYQKTLEGGWQGEVINIRKDGSEYPVILSAAPVRGENGDVIALIGIARDITERKQAEERERNRSRILESLTSGAALASILELIVRSVEAEDPGALCSILLLDDEGKHLLNGAAPSLPDFYNQAIHGLEIGDGVGSCGTAAFTKQRVIAADVLTHPYWANFRDLAQKANLRSCWSEPILSAEGRVLGTFAIYHREPKEPGLEDIKRIKIAADFARLAIERKRAEEALFALNAELEQRIEYRTRELEDANQELLLINREMDLRKQEAEEAKAQAETAKMQADAANRAKSDFLANMSHELRTPLNAIIGFSDIMINGMTGPLTDEQLDFTRDIGKSGKHLLTLINDILDLSKVEAGKMELEPGTVHVQELIERSLVMFKEKAMRHRINVERRVEAGIMDITADEMKLKQVLVNLLSNAFKYTPDGGTIAVRTWREAGGEVGFSVEDTGPGIKAEDVPKLFQPFQQLETTLSRKVPGTGLGLNLCKKFVEMHGGRIWVESEVGKGSRFLFVIPVS